MADLVIRGLSPMIVEWLRDRARRESVSPEEIARRVLLDAFVNEKGLGTAIREAVGPKGMDLEIPPRAGTRRKEPIDFFGPESGPDDDDPPGPGETPGPAESRAPTPKAAETDPPPR